MTYLLAKLESPVRGEEEDVRSRHWVAGREEDPEVIQSCERVSDAGRLSPSKSFE